MELKERFKSLLNAWGFGRTRVNRMSGESSIKINRNEPRAFYGGTGTMIRRTIGAAALMLAALFSLQAQAQVVCSFNGTAGDKVYVAGTPIPENESLLPTASCGNTVDGTPNAVTYTLTPPDGGVANGITLSHSSNADVTTDVDGQPFGLEGTPVNVAAEMTYTVVATTIAGTDVEGAMRTVELEVKIKVDAALGFAADAGNITGKLVAGLEYTGDDNAIGLPVASGGKGRISYEITDIPFGMEYMVDTEEMGQITEHSLVGTPIRGGTRNEPVLTASIAYGNDSENLPGTHLIEVVEIPSDLFNADSYAVRLEENSGDTGEATVANAVNTGVSGAYTVAVAIKPEGTPPEPAVRPFAVSYAGGTITVTSAEALTAMPPQALDHEAEPTYTETIVATPMVVGLDPDRDDLPTSEATLTVHVDDVAEDLERAPMNTVGMAATPITEYLVMQPTDPAKMEITFEASSFKANLRDDDGDDIDNLVFVDEVTRVGANFPGTGPATADEDCVANKKRVDEDTIVVTLNRNPNGEDCKYTFVLEVESTGNDGADNANTDADQVHLGDFTHVYNVRSRVNAPPQFISTHNFSPLALKAVDENKAEKATMLADGTTALNLQISDSNGDAMTCKTDPEMMSPITVSCAEGVVSLTVGNHNFEKVTGGTVSTTVIVEDPYEGSVSTIVTAAINDVNDAPTRAMMIDPMDMNPDPTKRGMIPVPVVVVGGTNRDGGDGDMTREIQPGGSVTVDANPLFADEDTDVLWNTITHTAAAAMADAAKVTVTVAAGVVTVAPVGAATGDVEIVITATDGVAAEGAMAATVTEMFKVHLTGKSAADDNRAPYFLNGVERVACSIYENRSPAQLTATTYEPHTDVVDCEYPAIDPDTVVDGDVVNYTYAATDGGDDMQFLVDPEGGLWLRGGKSVDHEAAGSHTGVITVDDGYGATDTLEITIYVLDINEAPVPTEYPIHNLGAVTGDEDAMPFRVGNMAIRDAKGSFDDPDEYDKPITYHFSVTGDALAVSSNANGSELTITGEKEGTAMFSVTASGSAEMVTPTPCPETDQTLKPVHPLTKMCSVVVGEMAPDPVTAATMFTVVVDANQPIVPDPDAVTDLLLPPNTSMTVDPNDYYMDPDGDEGVVLTSATSDNDSAVVAYINSSDDLILIGIAYGQADVTLNVTDEAGNDVESVTLTVSVNTLPELSLSHSELLIQLGDAGVIVIATFSDVDPGQTVTMSASSSDDAVATVEAVTGTTNQVTVTGVASGSATITVSVSDGQSIPGTASASVAVTVNAQPTVTDIDAITLNVGDTSDAIAVVAADTETAAEDLTIAASSDDTAVATVATDGNMLTVTGVSHGQANVEVTATDANGGSASITFAVTVNAAPRVVNMIADMVIGRGESSEVDISDVFVDAEGATTVSEMGVSSSNEAVVVAELLDDGATVLISGRSLGEAEVTVTAMDSNGVAVADMFTVKVNAAPSIAMTIDDQVVNIGATVDVDVSGTFTDGNGDTLTITAASGSSNATVAVADDTVTITGVSAGMAVVTVTATETDTLSDASVSESFDVRVNAAPTVMAPIADQSITEGSTAEIALDGVFADADGTVEVTGATSDDTDAVLVNLLDSGLVITGRAIGSANVTVHAMDNDGATTYDMFAVEVVSANAAPVVAASIGDQSTTRGDGAFGIALGGVFEDPDGDILMITAVSLDPSVGTATVTDDYVTLSLLGVGPGSVTITVTAADPAGLTAMDEFMLAVDTRPEAVGSLTPVTLEIGGEGMTQSIAGIFVDDDGDALTYTMSVSNQGIASVALTGMDLSAAPMSRGETTVTLTATDAAGYTASVSGAIGVGDGELRKVAEQSLAGFGRAMLSSVSTAVGSRVLSDVQNTDLSSFASSLVASQANRSGGMNGMGGGMDSYDSGMSSTMPTSASNNLWSGSSATDGSSGMMGSGLGSTSQSFSLSLNNADGVGAWSVWGNADRQSFEGTSYEGIASSVYLGVDVKSAECWLFGVAVASNSGETDYSYGTAEQTMDTSLTTVLPYFRYQPDSKSTIWGLVGIGSGDADTTVVGAANSDSDLSMNMYMVGGRRQISQLGRLDLALKGDFAMASLETDSGVGAIDGLAADISRVRGGIEGSFTTETGNGGSLTPFAEINLRQDGGDGDTGTGVEFSGGVRVNSATFSLEARGRVLAMHSADDYSENGFSIMASLNPSGDGSGISITLAPRWGGSAMDSGVMWSDQGIFGAGPQHLNLNRDTGRAVKAQFGYGYRMSNERYMLTPFVDLDMSANDRRQVLLGAKLNPMVETASNLGFDMTLGRVERRSTGESDAQVGVNATLRF